MNCPFERPSYIVSMSHLSSPAAFDPLHRRPLRRILRNWRQRHQHPVNFWIHMLGIPIAVAGVVLLCLQSWVWGASALFVGYLLQYVGHRVEGNDLGEWAAIKRIFGRPFVGIAPSRQVPPAP